VVETLKRKYDAMSETKNSYEELVSYLVEMPDRDATGILHRMRAGADIKSILRHIKEGNLLLQLSLTPETKLRYTFPYLNAMPKALLFHDNSYLNTALYDVSFLNEMNGTISGGAGPGQPSSNLVHSHSAYLSPYHAATIVDPRLQAAKASNWTTVIHDDGLFRSLLHSYLFHEYPYYPTLQKDSFLQDLARGKKNFCSAALVNAVLAEACVSNTLCLSQLFFFFLGGGLVTNRIINSIPNVGSRFLGSFGILRISAINSRPKQRDF
jgi:hypothetical protein